MTGLEDSEYKLDKSNGVWKRPGFSSIAYSDGEEIEQVLLRTVTEAGDLTSSSDELQSHCTDWVSTYHLSKQRANLLRPFEKQLVGSVLEVGAGCGAITRYLGEIAESVVAVEGSLRRAQILRQRTRDLENVSVVVDNFETFDIDQRFDVVVVVGVLEYADMFLNSDKPFIDFLRKLRKLVADGGLLLLAIENKLGLKYFAGANEDHLGAPMIGIEGRYQDGGPRTFSRNEIQSMMSEAGFSSQFFHSPVPDYKLPVGVITEQGILDEEFNSAALSGEASLLDPQLPLVPNFNPLLTWQEITGAAMEIEVSNSFLVEAHPTIREKSVLGDLLAEYMGPPRKQAFEKRKRFLSGGENVRIELTRFDNHEGSKSSEIALQNLGDEIYLEGPTVRLSVIKELTNAQDPRQVLEQWVPEWLDILATHARQSDFLWPSHLAARSKVDARLLDAIPRNAVFTQHGVFFFDQEWQSSGMISVDRLLLRTMLDVYGALAVGWQRNIDFRAFLAISFEVVGFNPRRIPRLLSDEDKLSRLILHQQIPRIDSLGWRD